MNQSYFYLKLETHQLHMSYKNEERRVRVSLPKNYDKDEAKNYLVVYMHDGNALQYRGHLIFYGII
jgi:predicted alpha/beta superfamily hydrolase